MKDVALAAGVSVTTVSHALNKTRNVESSTRDRILEAVKELCYEPNILARSLKGKGSRNLGIIIPDISESFFSEIVKAAERCAGEGGYNILLCDSEGRSDKEDLYISLLLKKGADGLIISPVDQNKEFLWRNHTDKPFVQIDRKVRKSGGNYIGIDNTAAAEIGTDLLVANGCHRIGFIGYGDGYSTMTERYKGYEQALRKANLTPLSFRSSVKDVSREGLSDWLEKARPDGLVCTNEILSSLACLAAAELDLQIPDDLKVVGFDDARWLTLLKSPLTVVRQPTEQIGEIAVQKLIDSIEHSTCDTREDLILPCEIHVRRSCGSRSDRIIKIG